MECADTFCWKSQIWSITKICSWDLRCCMCTDGQTYIRDEENSCFADAMG